MSMLDALEQFGRDHTGLLALLSVVGLPGVLGLLWKLLAPWRRLRRELRLAPERRQEERDYLNGIANRLEELKKLPLEHEAQQVVPLPARVHPGRPGRLPSDRSRGRRTADLVRFLLRRRRPTVVLGEPGAGKTVALRELGLALVERARRRGGSRLPIFLRLSEFQGDVEDPEASILDFVRRSLASRLGADGVLARFDELLLRGRFFFLLDGIDEMPRSQLDGRYRALVKLCAYVTRHTPNRLVASCRTRDFPGGLPLYRVEIERLDRARSRRYLQRSLPRAAAGRAMQELLSPAYPLRDLAANPFFLALMAAHYRSSPHAGPPRSRAELLQRLEEGMGGREDREPVASLDFLRRLLARLAFLLTSERTSERPREELCGRLTAAFDAASPQEVEQTLEQARARGLLVQSGPAEAPTLAFCHHRLQEYFTALELRRRGLSALRPELLADPWWQESLVMLMGLAPDPEAVIGMVLEGFPRQLLFADQLGPALGHLLTAREREELWATERAQAVLRRLDADDRYGIARALDDDPEEPARRPPARAGAAGGQVSSSAPAVVFRQPVDPVRELQKLGLVPWSPLPGLGQRLCGHGSGWEVAQAREPVVRWLGVANRPLLDLLEVAVECYRNAAERLPPAIGERLRTLVEQVLRHGDALAVARGVEMAARLPGLDLGRALQPALVHPESWCRRKALEELARMPLSRGVPGQIALTLLLQLGRGELLGSLPEGVRALRENPPLRRFLPGLLLLASAAVALALSPLLLYPLVELRLASWAAGWSGLAPAPAAAVATGAVTLLAYLLRSQLGIRVHRFTAFTGAALLLAPHLRRLGGVIIAPYRAILTNQESTFSSLFDSAASWEEVVRRLEASGLRTYAAFWSGLTELVGNLELTLLATLCLNAGWLAELAVLQLLALPLAATFGSWRLLAAPLAEARRRFRMDTETGRLWWALALAVPAVVWLHGLTLLSFAFPPAIPLLVGIVVGIVCLLGIWQRVREVGGRAARREMADHFQRTALTVGVELRKWIEGIQRLARRRRGVRLLARALRRGWRRGRRRLVQAAGWARQHPARLGLSLFALVLAMAAGPLLLRLFLRLMRYPEWILASFVGLMGGAVLVQLVVGSLGDLRDLASYGWSRLRRRREPPPADRSAIFAPPRRPIPLLRRLRAYESSRTVPPAELLELYQEALGHVPKGRVRALLLQRLADLQRQMRQAGRPASAPPRRSPPVAP